MTVNPQAAPTEKKQPVKSWRRRVQKENVPKFKTEMCKNIVAYGTCVYGEKCLQNHQLMMPSWRKLLLKEPCRRK